MTTGAVGWAAALAMGATVFAAPGLFGASAQTTAPAATPAPDPAFEARKSAFLAMPEADRKAAQDSLTWLGLYNGVVDGGFGKRTHDAILAFQASQKANVDGVLTPQQFAVLEVAADKLRGAVGFQIVDDPRSGARIGAPTKILDRRVPLGADTRLTKADGSATLDIVTVKGPEANLAALYGLLGADSPGRKVVYKAMKADAFFVVSTEEAGRKTYSRFAKGPPDASGAAPLRGFTFAYPAAAAAQYDRLTLAIANSFEPFPSGVLGSATAAVTPTPPVKPATPANETPAQAGPVLVATALVVGPGEAVTALAAPDCPTLAAGGKPAKILRSDAASGLALIGGEFAPKGRAPAFGTMPADPVALGFAGGGEGRANLVASPAEPVPGAARPMVIAALEASAGGGPLFDRRGALVGLIAPMREAPKHIAGVALAAPHAVIDEAALRAFLAPAAAAAASGPARSAGEIAAAMRGALLPVTCAR